MTAWEDATVRERVWDHISGARWFSGKGRCGSLTRLLPLAPVVNEQDPVSYTHLPLPTICSV